MAGQEVFKGALGWDDWIWWSGIGGLGLLLLMLVLCCIVCVQRAKRKGRDEALAAVQARERERQTQEQAQLRYAQAQQARYPAAREASYKFSKPEPPQATYNPYGHEDHGMRRNSYLNNAPAPKPKSRRGSQQPMQQQQDQGVQQYHAMPSREEQQRRQQQQPYQQYQQPQQPEQKRPPPPQQYGYESPATRPAARDPDELAAAYYGRKPEPSQVETPQRNAGPVRSHQYQRQQQVNPNQPLIAQYRKFSSRSPNGSFTLDSAHNETPFVQVVSPRGSAASTASTAPSHVLPPPQGFNDRGSMTSSSSSSMMRTGGTLRDRIDALRDGTAPAPPAADNHTRISVGSSVSLSNSQVSFHPDSSNHVPDTDRAPVLPAPRRLDVISGTVLSDASSIENEFADNGRRHDDRQAFEDEAAFATARGDQVRDLRHADSDLSIGVDDERESPASAMQRQRGRTRTNDSTHSVEF
jgi:hypothetical protein